MEIWNFKANKFRYFIDHSSYCDTVEKLSGRKLFYSVRALASFTKRKAIFCITTLVDIFIGAETLSILRIG